MSRAAVGNFFRPRVVFENVWALWATLLDKLHHFTMICKEIVLKKLLRGPYSGLGGPNLASGQDFAHPCPRQ